MARGITGEWMFCRGVYNPGMNTVSRYSLSDAAQAGATTPSPAPSSAPKLGTSGSDANVEGDGHSPSKRAKVG